MPIIRTITGFISVKDFSKFNELLENMLAVKTSLKGAGYEIQTVRITTDILETSNANLLENVTLHFLQENNNINIYHLGVIEDAEFLESTQDKIIKCFMQNKKAFVAVNLGERNENRKLALLAAGMCKKIAAQNPFECRRFAVYAGVVESTPFYPASKVFNNSMGISIGMQCADLAVAAAGNAHKDLNVFETMLREKLEQEFSNLEKLIPEKVKNAFIGFDTSLAPFPKDEMSIANAIEIILGKPFGASGTLSVCRILTRAMKKNNINKTGLCGLMLPVVEDSVLARRGIENRYTLRDLLLFSAVCATGLDTVPISGKITAEDLADCYNDLAALALKLNKPLSARLFVEPNKLPGDTVKYDWAFACESPVFKI